MEGCVGYVCRGRPGKPSLDCVGSWQEAWGMLETVLTAWPLYRSRSPEQVGAGSSTHWELRTGPELSCRTILVDPTERPELAPPQHSHLMPLPVANTNPGRVAPSSSTQGGTGARHFSV